MPTVLARADPRLKSQILSPNSAMLSFTRYVSSSDKCSSSDNYWELLLAHLFASDLLTHRFQPARETPLFRLAAHPTTLQIEAPLTLRPEHLAAPSALRPPSTRPRWPFALAPALQLSSRRRTSVQIDVCCVHTDWVCSSLHNAPEATNEIRRRRDASSFFSCERSFFRFAFSCTLDRSGVHGHGLQSVASKTDLSVVAAHALTVVDLQICCVLEKSLSRQRSLFLFGSDGQP